MRSRAFILVLMLLAASGLAQAAEDDDKVMGNYHGKFTSGPLGSSFIRAEVVALSKTHYRAVLYIGAQESSAARVEIKGKRENETTPVALSGEVDLGASGGACSVSSEIAGEQMGGKVTCQGKASEFSLERVFLKPPTLGAAPPAAATVLMDGKQLDAWVRDPETWCLQPDGSTTVCGSNFKTRQEFGAAKYHVEFMTPFMPESRGQGRGNSGVYILGRYEVQVLDSFGDLPADNLCGGIYKRAIPSSMAALPPLQWQTYDITFIPAKFDASGAKTENAIITVILNGITIHDKVSLSDLTPGGVSDKESVAGPIMLQDHDNNVSYRNIWVEPIKE